MNDKTKTEESKEKKSITIYVPVSFHKKMKKLAVELEEPVSTLVEKAMKNTYKI